MQKLPLPATGDSDAVNMRVRHRTAVNDRCLDFQYLPGRKIFTDLRIQPGTCLHDLRQGESTDMGTRRLQTGSQFIQGLDTRDFE